MGKALVVYASRTGQTKRIAELIAEGIRMAGQEAELVDASRIREPSQLEGFGAYVFGSATYHGEMLPSMKQLLFMAEKAGLKGRVGGSFGAFGWSGEAPERIYQTMKNVFGMEMVGDSLRLKSAALEGGVRMAQGYGRDVGAKLAS